jgi:hypothetical protein
VLTRGEKTPPRVQAKKESDTDGVYTDAERGADADRLAAMLADMSAAVDSLNLGLLAVAAEVRKARGGGLHFSALRVRRKQLVRDNTTRASHNCSGACGRARGLARAGGGAECASRAGGGRGAGSCRGGACEACRRCHAGGCGVDARACGGACGGASSGAARDKDVRRTRCCAGAGGGSTRGSCCAGCAARACARAGSARCPRRAARCA